MSCHIITHDVLTLLLIFIVVGIILFPNKSFIYITMLFYFLYKNCIVLMAAVESRYHREDGGADPPPDPTRVPAPCQSGNISICLINYYYSLVLLINVLYFSK